MDDTRVELDEALSLAQKKDYARALEICEAFIKDNPSLSDGFRTRARIHRLMGNFTSATNDITSAIQKEAEPGDYFFRGWWNLENDDLSTALEDLTMVIRLGDEVDLHYFDESAFFFRALVLLRLGRFKEALADCENVRDDFLIYLRSGQVSKRQIVEEATSKKK